jgi:hypothetical protein
VSDQSVTPPAADPRPLRAGPLALVYQDGDLRSVTLAGREVVRRILMAVRDRNWGTLPNRLSNVQLEQGADWFRITYDAESRQGEIDFAWSARLSGDAQGALTFAFEGQARSTFLKNRLGMVVLHPMRECAGAACRVERVDGQVVESAFPVWISPHRPFEEIRAIAHAVQPGVWAELRFEGDTFEMEDQRNWTDASFKTYSTPVRLGFPAEVQAGTRIAQSVTLRLLGDVPQSMEAKAAEPTLSIGDQPAGRLPRLGLGLASHGRPLTPTEIERVRALRLGHLRADLRFSRPDWRGSLQRATAEARELGAGLELALHLSLGAEQELTQLVGELDSLRPSVARWLVYSTEETTPDEALIRLARERLAAYDASVPLVGGTDAYFMDLNSQRPPAELLDGLCYSINPQAHAFDTPSLMETFEAQTATVLSARHFAPGKPLHISPLTLRPRFNPVATGPEPKPAPGQLPSAVDARQMRLEGAAWTLGSLQALAETGAVESVTLYETTGWRGVMESEAGSPLPEAFPSTPGMLFPLYHVLAALGALREAEVLPVAGTHPLKVAALAYRMGDHQGTLVANTSAQPITVRVQGAGQHIRLRRLDEQTGWSAGNVADVMRLEAGQVVLSLGPYQLVRLEARRAG